MPKLNTTVDNIELKSNKLLSSATITSSTLTDAKYPSAKAVLNITHPVGSILTTSTNTNPAATIGGSWELIDKAFKNSYVDVGLNESTYWTNTNAGLVQYSNVMLVDHNIAIRLNLSLEKDLSDSTTVLGKLNLPLCGISELSYAVLSDVAISDGGNCTINFKMAQDGEISVMEVLNLDDTHSMASNQTFYLNIVQPIMYTKMLDSFCDKFYWKRTA